MVCQHYSTFKPHLRLVRCPGTAASSCYSTGHHWLGRRLLLHRWLVLCLHQPPLPISNLNRHIFCRFCYQCLGWNRHETRHGPFYYSRKTGRHQHGVSLSCVWSKQWLEFWWPRKQSAVQLQEDKNYIHTLYSLYSQFRELYYWSLFIHIWACQFFVLHTQRGTHTHTHTGTHTQMFTEWGTHVSDWEKYEVSPYTLKQTHSVWEGSF